MRQSRRRASELDYTKGERLPTSYSNFLMIFLSGYVFPGRSGYKPELVDSVHLTTFPW